LFLILVLQALLGPVAATSYSIMYQLGFFMTMICESISIATQSLLSRYSFDESEKGRALSSFIIRRAFHFGGILAVLSSLTFYLFRLQIVSIFAESHEIQMAALETVPVFLLTQSKLVSSLAFSGLYPINVLTLVDVVAKGFAFPMNGVVMGRKEWGISFWSMCFANVMCFTSLRCFGRQRVQGLWLAWTAYYLAQGFAGLVCLKWTNKSIKTGKNMS
jgi:Na+-driven multidrug efflux pump